MYSFKLNLAATFVLFCLLGSVAKGQLASSKPMSEIYSKRISDQLAKQNRYTNISKPSEKVANLPSSKLSLKDVAKSKIKNPEIVAHVNLTRSYEEKKDKLPSNSPYLKKIGTPVKPKKIASQ